MGVKTAICRVNASCSSRPVPRASWNGPAAAGRDGFGEFLDDMAKWLGLGIAILEKRRGNDGSSGSEVGNTSNVTPHPKKVG